MRATLFRRLPLLLMALAWASFLTGCSPADIVNALVPSDHYRLHRAISYAVGSDAAAAAQAGQGPAAIGAGSRRELDVYVPNAAATGGSTPVVVFFYGGRWQTGNREAYRFVGEALASKGFIAVVPDYRLYPEAGFPVFMQDAAAAVKWVVHDIGGYGGDPGRIFLMGHSAGAHIAALLALDPSYLRAAGVDRGFIHGMIGLSGPYDFLPLTDPKLKALFGAEERLMETQPINFVSASEPPLLLIHGLDDTTVRPRNSQRLAAKAKSAGAQATLIELPDYGHLQTVARLAAPLRFRSSVLDDIAAFVRAN